MTKARTQLVTDVIGQLEDAGFNLSSQCDVRPSCFDLVARKGDQLILVKVLGNIDALTAEDAMSLQLVAHFFNATPLIIGKKTRRGKLDDGVVYKRYGVSTIAPPSFERLVSEQQLPREFVQRGGRFVAIDGAKLREARRNLNISTEELAKCAQVSTGAILAYERDEIDVSKDVAEKIAEKLELVLETDLIIPVDLLSKPSEVPKLQGKSEKEWVSDIERRVDVFFERLGMSVLWTDRAPFHVAAKEEGPPLMSGVGSLKSWTLKKRMGILKSVSEITDSETVIIVEEGQAEENVSDLPVIRQLELDEIEKSDELKKIISERSGQ
ncbi:transcriptional regulator [Candidatus Thorarchaeota archaeon]|jgi:putative transcriptional regulator|nr:MAG: transcriptional regulator [Candidatus Thorarchaeota archaeon]